MARGGEEVSDDGETRRRTRFDGDLENILMVVSSAVEGHGIIGQAAYCRA